MPSRPEPRPHEPEERRRWFRRRRRVSDGQAPDQAVGDFGSEEQSDEGGDSDTT